jgi:hypothetical protein
VRATSIIAGLLVAAALIPVALLTTSPDAAAAVQAKPGANSLGASIVAGIHDTAINDCVQLKGKSATAANRIKYATASLRSGYWPSGVHNVRVTLPWDIADPGAIDMLTNGATHSSSASVDKSALATTRLCFNDWLQGVFSHGLSPEIDFRADQDYKLNGTPMMPTLAQYRAAVAQFSDAYVDCGTSCTESKKVTVIAPWNEPDNYNIVFPDGHTHLAGNQCPAKPTAADCGAVMAAQMWAVTDGLVVQGGANGTKCPTCTIVAGDFSGKDGLGTITGKACPHKCSYLDLYDGHLVTNGHRFHPAKWAVHPYGDIKAYQDGTSGGRTQLAEFAAQLKGDGYGTKTYIWLNEISTCASRQAKSTCSSGNSTIKQWRSQNAAMHYLLYTLPLTVAANGPQVGRIDYYCFNGGRSQCTNDWALVINSETNPKPTEAEKTFAAWARRALSGSRSFPETYAGAPHDTLVRGVGPSLHLSAAFRTRTGRRSPADSTGGYQG